MYLASFILCGKFMTLSTIENYTLGKHLVGAIDVLMRNSLVVKKCISITIAFIVSADFRFSRDSEGNCVVQADNNLVIGAACV